MDKWLIVLICVGAGLVLLCFLLAIANFASDRFFEEYKKVDQIEAYCELSTIDYVSYLNQKYFDGKIRISRIEKLGGDAYGKGILFLSDNTLNKKSIASFSIVSHELGHALQDKAGTKLKKLSLFKRILRVLGALMMPLIIAGAITFFILPEMRYVSYICFGAGILLFISALVLRILTISIEKEASDNAMKFLSEILSEKQLKICKKFLNSARLTYWGEFLRVLLFWTFLSRKTKLFN